jgi:putative glutamine amidotransferase
MRRRCRVAADRAPVRMKWFATYPEDGPSVAVYRNWVVGGDIDCEVSTSDFQLPRTLSDFDALLLAGGGDVAPSRYGDNTLHPKTYDVSERRDAFELALIAEFLAQNKPVFGICRGIQILSVALGGKLIQHIPDRLGMDNVDETHSKKGTYDSMHGVVFDAESGLGRVLYGVHEVNSAHHQAVDPAAVGTDLQVAARSPRGVIEAVESADPGKRIVAVQWHPERLATPNPASAVLRDYWKSLV